MTELNLSDYDRGLRDGRLETQFAMANRLLVLAQGAPMSGNPVTSEHGPECTIDAGRPCRANPCTCYCHRPYLFR